MTQTLYALLVGINTYDASSRVPALRGCQNDVQAWQAYLKARVGGYQLQVKSLVNEQATRSAVIEGLRQHLGQAGEGDTAFFFYAGHGSQEMAPEAFWPVEPDRLNETLVCYDSRTDGQWDLADKELAKLVAEVSAKGAHTTIVLDCCHSGSGTRGDGDVAVSVRRAPTDRRSRPVDTYLVSPTEVEPPRPVTRGLVDATAGWRLPQGRHVLLAACQDIEEAKEYVADGQPRGTFSYFLLETLQTANGALSYRDLFKRAHALVRSKVTAQTPQLEAPHLADLDQAFLGGAIAPHPPYFTVSHPPDYGWVIDGGAVHGVQAPTAGEATQLALFSFDSGAEQLREMGGAIATATVTDVLPQLSRIQPSTALDTQTTYKAVVTDLPLPPVGVFLEGDPGSVARIRQVLQPSRGQSDAALYIREVADIGAAKFRVRAAANEYVITRPMEARPLVSPVANGIPVTPYQLVARLVHMARWNTIVELESPAASQLPADAVRLELYQNNERVETPQLHLTYEQRDGRWQPPRFKAKLVNTTAQRLYCALLDLTEEFSVSAPFFSSGGTWLDPYGEAWATVTIQNQLTDQIPTNVPTVLWEQGVTEYQDTLKLIVSTAEFDPTLLLQSKLDKPQRRTTRSLRPRSTSTLNRLMNRMTTRDIGLEEETETVDDWVTSQVNITTMRPLETASLTPNHDVALGQQVTVAAHPRLTAKARLVSAPEQTRSLGEPPLPPLLREQTEPLVFTPSMTRSGPRSLAPSLTTLELTEVANPEAVTPAEPLKLVMDAPLAETETVLPGAYDGEFFLPLGYGQRQGQQTAITLERLPQAQLVEEPAIGTRSLGGAIRIYFQKVVTRKLGKSLSQKLGITFEYPILAAVDVEQGEATYSAEASAVADRVAGAQKIVVFVHGIIGDTESMVPSVETAQAVEDGLLKPLKEIYDLVLTYDYESINTTIEMNALKLRQRLQSVGLGAGHGKTVHIVAHSMGGLVSRWFIEQEGGNEIVQHLIMLGTPNAGSPWPNVQAGVTAAIGFAINGLSTVVWPIRLLGSAVEKLETIDVTLDQMEPNSEFLAELATASDPKIPYSIVAGNTSLIEDGEKGALRERLKNRILDAAELPFFGKDNDIAVSVESIKNVPGSRAPQPDVREVACNHLVYFVDVAGLEGLSWAVSRAFVQSGGLPSGPETAEPGQRERDGAVGSSPAQGGQQFWVGVIALATAVVAAVGGMIWLQGRSSPQPATSTGAKAKQLHSRYASESPVCETLGQFDPPERLL